MDQNIKVGVRCRPLSSKEIDRGCAPIIQMTPTTVRMKKPDDEQSVQDFTFDHCYFSDSTQEMVYRDLGLPLLSQALDGFNGTIFAYGQTGSGKSHSMTGTESDRGIIPRLNNDLWSLTKEKLQTFKAGSDGNGGDFQFMITVSFLEIYNEVIKDLLNPRDKPLKIRENSESGIYVEGLCELIVRSPSDLLKLIDQGNTVRRVAATNMNDQSSRSHSCFTIKIEKKVITQLAGGVTRESLSKAKLNLVDLAGSERADKTGATGSTLKEGAAINMSLMALGNVINALSEGSKKFVPYRDSKLTRLLQESLGGNALTVMLAAISPADYNYDETLSTLKYANRAKSIANAVSKNEDSTERMINDLKAQIEQLKNQLQTGGGAEENPEMEKKLKEMEASQQDAWHERERLSRELEAERQANMNTVISTMMTTVKEQKIHHMKVIKRLSNEKTSLSTGLKEGKETNAQLKARLDTNMRKYQKLQAEYEEHSISLEGGDEMQKAIARELSESIANEMAKILATVEVDRAAWLQTRDDIKAMKERLAAVEEEMTQERGELVATAGLLDQNDKLRAQIQEEEREKAKEMIASELAVAREQLDKEREQVRGSVEGELQSEMAQLRGQLEDMQLRWKQEQLKAEAFCAANKQLGTDLESMEQRLAEAEVNQESSQSEVQRLALENQEIPRLRRQIDELAKTSEQLQAEADRRVRQAKHDAIQALNSTEQQHLSKAEAEKYEVFRVLMDGFDLERSDMQQRIVATQALFASSVRDIMFLVEENESLKASLAQAVKWEPPIRPNHRMPPLQTPTASTPITAPSSGSKSNSSSSRGGGGDGGDGRQNELPTLSQLSPRSSGGNTTASSSAAGSPPRGLSSSLPPVAAASATSGPSSSSSGSGSRVSPRGSPSMSTKFVKPVMGEDVSSLFPKKPTEIGFGEDANAGSGSGSGSGSGAGAIDLSISTAWTDSGVAVPTSAEGNKLKKVVASIALTSKFFAAGSSPTRRKWGTAIAAATISGNGGK